MWQKEKLLVLSYFFFWHHFFKKPSAAEASESDCMWGKDNSFSAKRQYWGFLQTIQIQVSQLIISCPTWNQHCLPFIHKLFWKLLLQVKWRRIILNMEESILNNSALKELRLCFQKLSSAEVSEGTRLFCIMGKG